MNTLAPFFMLPQRMEIWIFVAYVQGVTVAARLLEMLARAHFHRARRISERGFEYFPEADHYRCGHGAHLSLHQYHPEKRLAVYRAPKHKCNPCPRKQDCTPHDEGRHIYRSLSQWAETDVGRFHSYVSLLIFAVSAALSLVLFLHWYQLPGSGLVALSLLLSCYSFTRSLRRFLTARSPRGSNLLPSAPQASFISDTR